MFVVALLLVNTMACSITDQFASILQRIAPVKSPVEYENADVLTNDCDSLLSKKQPAAIAGELHLNMFMTSCSTSACRIYLDRGGKTVDVYIQLGSGQNSMEPLPSNYSTSDLIIHSESNGDLHSGDPATLVLNATSITDEWGRSVCGFQVTHILGVVSTSSSSSESGSVVNPTAESSSFTGYFSDITKDFSFSTDQFWYDTGFFLEKGQNITIEASGSFNLSNGDSQLDVADPNGWGDVLCNWDTCAFTDAPMGALVAKIGDGNPFYVGSSRLLKAANSGNLLLAVNDGIHDYADNQGSVYVKLNFTGAGDLIRTITLPSDAGWFDSELYVEQGQTLIFKASGSFNMGEGDPAWDIPDPNGGSGICEESECALSGGADGALVAAVYGLDPFFVGTSLETLAPGSNALMLSVNDCADCFSDNSGSFEVTITVR